MVEVQHADSLLQILLENNVLTTEQVKEVQEEQKRTGSSIRQVIINMELVSEDDLLEIIANQWGTTVVDLTAKELQENVLKSIPASVSRMYNVVPIDADANSVVLATSQLLAPEIIDEIRFVLSKDVTYVLAREDNIKNTINQYYGDDSASMDQLLSTLESEMEEGKIMELSEEKEDVTGLEEAANAPPVVRFVNLILYEAVQSKASDIHFEPFEKDFKIRYRVDGALYEISPPPRRLALPIISRIKVMSNLNIAERRVPQDGRLQMRLMGRPIDFRVSTLPTQFGESVVLRVLDRTTVSLELEKIGMAQDIYGQFTQAIKKPNGIIIVTGPTGCGKTTTLYSALRRINTIESKLLTVEDPVEYDIEGIIQVQVNEAINVTFSRMLRSFLRQDPDIIMIGEIRDLETAEIAVQASLTGHLVFTTLHTNDSAGAITRLIDMDIEPFLISSTLEVIFAQRLVRSICEHCKVKYTPDKKLLDRLNLSKDMVTGRPFYYGKGCSKCHNSGYKGRRGIFEYMAITPAIRALINERKPTGMIRSKAVEEGMRLLRDDGIRNLFDGNTSAEEILTYT